MVRKDLSANVTCGSLDVYDCIGSKEIRDYYRRTWELSAEEKAGLVRYAMLPIQKKQELFEELIPEADNETGEQLKICSNVINVFLDQIYSPKGRVLYVMERELPKDGLLKEGRTELMLYDGLNSIKCTDLETAELLFADTIEGVTAKANEYIYWDTDNTGKAHHELFYVYCIPVSDNRKSESLIEFYMMEIDGKAEITDFYFDTGRCEELGTDKRSYKVYDNGFEFAFHRNIVLPYETGDILRVRTPIMEYPAYGYFTKEFALGWYNHLYVSKEDALSSDRVKSIRFLSLSELFPEFHPYFLFDCVEKANK